MRTHVVLPEDLIKEVDRLAGRRKRSRFIEDAVRRKLQNEKQRQAFADARGIFTAEDHPHWATPDKADAWLRELRHVDEERCRELWEGRGE